MPLLHNRAERENAERVANNPSAVLARRAKRAILSFHRLHPRRRSHGWKP